MRAELCEYEDFGTRIFVVDIYDGLNWQPLDAIMFLNEFAAQTYADAINIGVIQYKIED